MPCPTKPQMMPARLYSANLMPRHASLAPPEYRLPGCEGAKAALGTLASKLCSPGTRACCQHLWRNAVGSERSCI